ncbi:hypothetical protein [Arthrobacter sp. MDT1-65]
MTAPQDDAHLSGPTRVLPPTPGAPATRTGPDRAGIPAFSPRQGRLGVALVGLVALAATLVTLVLGLLDVVSFLVPLLCLAVAAAAVAALRMLAVRRRRARVDRAFHDAMAPVHAPAASEPAVLPAAVAPRRPTRLFDAEEAGARRLTPMELRTAALAVAHGSTLVDVRSMSRVTEPEAETEPEADTEHAAATRRTDDTADSTADTADSTADTADSTADDTADSTAADTADDTSAGPTGSPEWAPVDVPRPTYVDAAKAERQAPAPLDLPEAPKPTTRTPIKASEAAARIAATEETDREADVAAPATGRINLDDVLQRRRA